MLIKEEKITYKKKHISSEKKQACFDLFNEGYGYKKTARLTDMNIYTVRDCLRKYKAGDISWLGRDSGYLLIYGGSIRVSFLIDYI